MTSERVSSFVVVVTQWTDDPAAVFGPFESEAEAAAFTSPLDGTTRILRLTAPTGDLKRDLS